MPKQIEGEPFQRISVDEAAELHGSDDVAFVDVRRMDEYVEGHVKGAIFITVDDILSRIEELPSEYFQSVEPLNVHDNTPFSFIHC